MERFHATGDGSVPSNRSMNFYSLPGLEVRGDIIFRARKIQKEQRTKRVSTVLTLCMSKRNQYTKGRLQKACNSYSVNLLL